MDKDSKKPEYKYLQFPICALQKVAKDNSYIGNLLCYGIWYYGKDEDYSTKDAARQVLFDYYRHKDRMNAALLKQIDNCMTDGRITEDEDYNGFIAANFEPDTSELIDLFTEDPGLYSLCLDHYRLHQAAEGLGIEPHPARQGKVAGIVLAFQQEQERLHGSQPMPSVKKSIVFNFRDNPKDIELFLAYVAIRSIIGPQSWKRTSKQAIVSRMIGAKSNKALDYILSKDAALKAIYDKYMGRYQFDKLISRLLIGKFITAKISRRHALFVSCRLSMDELGSAIIFMNDARKFKEAEIEQRKRISNNITSNIKKHTVTAM
jgi:hypothetical protein